MTEYSAPGGPEPDAPRMDALLEQMREACATLEAKTLEHEKLLEDERYDEFVHALASRAPVIDRLAHASTALDTILADPRAPARYPGSVLGAVRRELDELSMLVANVLRKDEIHQKVVEARRDALSGQLSGVKQGRHAIRAYSGAAGRSGPRLQDREG